MDDDSRSGSNGGRKDGPITEADLHAYVDDRLIETRRADVERYLDERPGERARVLAWREQNEALRAMLDPIVDEAVPVRLPLAPRSHRWVWQRYAVAASIAFVSVLSGWLLRGAFDGPVTIAMVGESREQVPAAAFARRAAIAHVVYSPDVRRPVEIGAEQEDQLVAWLSKRLGAQLKPPKLGAQGYELIGGRLLPGGSGPVAQFMYHDASGQRLTLYISSEHKSNQDTAFQFAQEGPVNVFYWIDGQFGYAISAGVDRAELARVARAVYDQLSPK